MLINITDGDYEVMKRLESLINNAANTNAKCFTTPQKLIDAVRETPPDIVLVDVDSSCGSSAVGIIRSASPETKIIIMSAEKEKAAECFKLNSDGFLLKPIEEEKLREQLFRVRHPLLSRIKYGSERTAAI